MYTVNPLMPDIAHRLSTSATRSYGAPWIASTGLLIAAVQELSAAQQLSRPSNIGHDLRLEGGVHGTLYLSIILRCLCPSLVKRLPKARKDLAQRQTDKILLRLLQKINKYLYYTAHRSLLAG